MSFKTLGGLLCSITRGMAKELPTFCPQNEGKPADNLLPWCLSRDQFSGLRYISKIETRAEKKRKPRARTHTPPTHPA